MVFSRAKPAKKPSELNNRSPLAGLYERKKTFKWPWLKGRCARLGIETLRHYRSKISRYACKKSFLAS